VTRRVAEEGDPPVALLGEKALPTPRGFDMDRPPLPPFTLDTAVQKRKWQKERDYRLIKEIWGFRENRIAVRFAYEWRDASDNWFRSYGNENWEFDEHGLMRRRIASINDLPLAAKDRLFHWPLGRRPDDHPSLSDLDL
jgi:uncharacterized protein